MSGEDDPIKPDPVAAAGIRPTACLLSRFEEHGLEAFGVL